MTGIAYALGTHAWGTCQKCGLRFRYLDLRDDGYWKHLQVCKECWDGIQPQEKLLRVSDPVALWRGTPDTIYPPTAVVLSDPVLLGDDVELAWSASTSPDSGVAGYLVLRAVNAGEFSQIANLPVTRDFIATIVNEPLSYTDENLSGGVYSYSIQAYDMRDPPLVSDRSNIVAVTVP